MYKVFVQGINEPFILSDKDGKNVASLVQNAKGGESITIGKNVFRASSVKAVISAESKDVDTSNEARILGNIESISAFYKRRSETKSIQKADHEMGYRVGQVLRFSKHIDPKPIRESLVEFYERNPRAVVCPFEVWKKHIHGASGLSLRMIEMVIKNDHAVERWENKTGEFDPRYIHSLRVSTGAPMDSKVDYSDIDIEKML